MSDRFDGFVDNPDQELQQSGGHGGGIDLTARFEPYELACYEEFLLHKHGGYTYDPEGRIGAIAKQERCRFFEGYGVWRKVQQMRERQQAHGDKPGQSATAGDHRAFNEYASEQKQHRAGGKP